MDVLEHDGFEGIDNGQNLGAGADPVVIQCIGVTAAIRHFVMLGDHFGCRLPARHAQQKAGRKAG
jgi:hypothetical protein